MSNLISRHTNVNIGCAQRCPHDVFFASANAFRMSFAAASSCTTKFDSCPTPGYNPE
jgi:hypothetical protein